MGDRDLIFGVLAVRSGFVSPAQVMAAASAWLAESKSEPLAARLEAAGLLTAQRRKLVEELADEAFAMHAGDGKRAIESLGGEAVLSSTYGLSLRGPAPDAATWIADAARALPEERPGQYTRLGELGRGAQSIVHRAIDEFIGREVALKELLPIGPGDFTPSSPAARVRFLREARLTAQLDHPGIVAVHELARRPDGTLFCSQKLVRGETLRTRLSRCASLKERLQLLPNLIGACHAVAYAHSHGVVHRDLKPSNIMVGAFGETVVVDWGLAKKRGEADPRDESPTPSPVEPALTVAGIALGTPAYMSPEQARGKLEEIDERSDVFSLGAILYELLTARRPFEGADSQQVIAKVLEGRVAPVRSVCPEAPVELVAVAERALKSDPGERYPGAESLAQELSAYQTGGRVQAYEYRSFDLLKRFVARNPALSAVSAAALAVLIGASVVIAGQLQSTRANLAAAFIDRAKTAERDLDWGRAAAFYAASRVQRDSRQAQWGVALNQLLMPHKISSRALGPVAHAEVGFLPDGRALLFTSPGPSLLVAEEVEGGRELWRATLPGPGPDGGVWLRGALLLAYYDKWARWRVYDPQSGRVIADGPESESPCLGPLSPPPALWRREGGKWRLEVARSPAPIVLAETSFNVGFRCSVDTKGTRLATYENNTLVLWDLATLEPIAKRPDSNFGVTTFTPHGLAVPVRDSTDVLTGSPGDFSIPSGSGGGYAFYSGAGNSIVGFFLRGDRADVIDLEERRITSTLALSSSFGPPHVAISDDGARLLVVPPAQPPALVSWALPRSSSVKLPRKDPVGGVTFSADGSRFATASGPLEGRVEIDVWTREGALVRSFGAQTLRRSVPVLSSDGSRLALYSASRAAVWDAGSSVRLLDIDCPVCSGMVLSANGSLALASEDYRVSLWDVAGQKRRWTLAREIWTAAGADLSGDGTLAAWADEVSLTIVAADSGATRVKIALLGHAANGVAFSHDAKRIAVASLKGVFVWKVDGTPLWSSALVKARFPLLQWSADDSKLILGDEESTIVDSGTGELLAHIDPEARSPQPRSFVSPDLRYLVKKGRAAWQLQPLPQPEEGPPSRVLAGVLDQADLELRGAELAPADQLRNASSSRP